MHGISHEKLQPKQPNPRMVRKPSKTGVIKERKPRTASANDIIQKLSLAPIISNDINYDLLIEIERFYLHSEDSGNLIEAVIQNIENTTNFEAALSERRMLEISKYFPEPQKTEIEAVISLIRDYAFNACSSSVESSKLELLLA